MPWRAICRGCDRRWCARGSTGTPRSSNRSSSQSGYADTDPGCSASPRSPCYPFRNRSSDNMTDTPQYTPPDVWVWEKDDSPKWRYGNVNRPIAGATHEKALPRGKHPLQLYSLATPNGVKVTIMLEELLAAGHSGAEYDAWLIQIGEGDQFGSGFVGVNPNSKIPALMDYSEQTPRRVFESGAILLYLADKFGAFLSKDRGKRTEALN